MDLENVPEVVLIKLLSYLETEQLVGCARAVCRRWRALALSPQAWQHRDLYIDSQGDKKQMVIRALQVAPCVRRLTTGVDELKTIEGFLDLVSTTSCAARQLDLVVTSKSFSSVTRIFKNQLKLGRLRRLLLSMDCNAAAFKKTLRLIEAVDLEELSISYSDQFDPSMVLPSRPWMFSGNIKSVSFPGVHVQDPLLELLLVATSKTVEEVGLCMATLRDFTSQPISVLAHCEQLRSLSTPATLGLRYLNQCPRLTSLCVNVGISPFGPFPTTLEPTLLSYFSKATNLTELSLVCLPLRVKACSLVMAIVAALAESGRSSLEKLKISALSDFDPTPEDMLMGRGSPFDNRSDLFAFKRLPELLRGLPRLQSLELANCPAVEALDGVDAKVAPRLERLAVSGMTMCGVLTPAHVEAVTRLTRRLPWLHAKLVCGYGKDSCQSCSVTLGPRGAVGMFAHPAAQECKTHDVGIEWRCVASEAQ